MQKEDASLLHRENFAGRGVGDPELRAALKSLKVCPPDDKGLPAIFGMFQIAFPRRASWAINKVAELKAALGFLSLSTKGYKDQLVERISNAFTIPPRARGAAEKGAPDNLEPPPKRCPGIDDSISKDFEVPHASRDPAIHDPVRIGSYAGEVSANFISICTKMASMAISISATRRTSRRSARRCCNTMD